MTSPSILIAVLNSHRRSRTCPPRQESYSPKHHLSCTQIIEHASMHVTRTLSYCIHAVEAPTGCDIGFAVSDPKAIDAFPIPHDPRVFAGERRSPLRLATSRWTSPTSRPPARGAGAIGLKGAPGKGREWRVGSGDAEVPGRRAIARTSPTVR